MGSLGSASVRRARRTDAARHGERSWTDAAVCGERCERRGDPALGPGLCRRLLARAARQRRPVARPRLASRSLSTAREWRTAQAHERKRRDPRGSHARRVRTVQLRGLERREGLRLPGESAGLRQGQEVSDRLHRARRPAGELSESLELALERADLRRPRLRSRVHRFSRVARLRPGIHRFHQPALGRSAVRGSEKGLRRRVTEIPVAGRHSAPARWALPTAATCRTGSPGTGPTVSAAS